MSITEHWNQSLYEYRRKRHQRLKRAFARIAENARKYGNIQTYNLEFESDKLVVYGALTSNGNIHYFTSESEAIGLVFPNPVYRRVLPLDLVSTMDIHLKFHPVIGFVRIPKSVFRELVNQ